MEWKCVDRKCCSAYNSDHLLKSNLWEMFVSSRAQPFRNTVRMQGERMQGGTAGALKTWKAFCSEMETGKRTHFKYRWRLKQAWKVSVRANSSKGLGAMSVSSFEFLHWVDLRRKTRMATQEWQPWECAEIDAATTSLATKTSWTEF